MLTFTGRVKDSWKEFSREIQAWVTPLFSDLGFSLLLRNCMFRLNVYYVYCIDLLFQLSDAERGKTPAE